MVVYQDAKRRGIYLALWTDPEGDSIYQVSWKKIKNKLFGNKRRHSEFIYVAIDCVSGITFYDFLANSVRTDIFFYWPVNVVKPNFVSFLVFVGAAASFIAKISSFETVAKREAILDPCYWCGAYLRVTLISTTGETLRGNMERIISEARTWYAI